MVSYTVIGAGIAGLTLARELSRLGVAVRVIEYRDYAGGIHSLHPELTNYINDVLKDVEVMYRTTAVSIEGDYYEIGEAGSKRIESGIVATGFRVMTLPELGIYGDRPAGVYPFHAVLDLLHYGLLPGKRVIIYGDNPYAALLGRALMERGCEVTLVSPKPLSTDVVKGLRVLQGRVRYVRGVGRVERVLVENNVVNADTLVIAMFKPYNPFPGLKAVGQAVIETYDPNIVIESGKILAGELAVGGRDYVRIVSDLPIYPGDRVSRDLRKVIVVVKGGGKVMVDDKEYFVDGDAIVLNLPNKDEVIIKRVVE